MTTYDSGDVGAGCGGGGCDYTALATWEAATQGDLSGGGVITLECYDSQNHDDNVTIAGSSNESESDRRRVISSASCSTPFAGKSATGANFVYDGASNYIFALAEAHARVEQLCVKFVGDVAGAATCVPITLDDAKAIKVVAYDCANQDVGNVAHGFSQTENNNLFYCCIAHSGDGDGFQFNSRASELSAAVCCTAANNAGTGFISNQGAGEARCFSCYAMDNTTAAFGAANWDETTADSSWNASDDATADLNIPVNSYDNNLDLDASLDADYLATASLDTRDGVDNVGEGNCGKSPVDDLSGVWNPDSFFTTPDALYATDIAGNTRPAGTDAQWDVGASEYVAAGGAAPTATLYGPLVGPLGGPI